MNVICYKRVSTEDQKDNGFSLQHQEEMLRGYCEINKFNIVDMYTEDYSAKTFDRPEWKKIMAYIKGNRGKVDLVLCHKWDRFSRNHYDAQTIIRDLHKLGVTINTVEQPLDLTNPDNKVLLSLYLTIPEVENDKNSLRTIDGSRRARFEGCWTGTRPRGYVNFRDNDKKSTLLKSSDAPLIIEAFERMASGSYSADEVRRWLNSKDIKMSKQTFLSMIRNPVYIGKIQVKQYKKEPAQLVMGLHQALISEDIFLKANDVLAGRKRKMKFHNDKSDIYPLKGFLKCPVHGTAISAYAALGRKKELYHYYVCPKDRCVHRYKISVVHESIEGVLKKISAQAQVLTLYRKILEKMFEKEGINRKNEIQKTNVEIEKIHNRRSKLQNMLLDDKITTDDYTQMKQQLDKDLLDLSNKLNDLKQQITPYQTYINKTVPMLENISEFYKNSNGMTKKKILACIFSEKLILEQGKVASIPFTIPIQVLINTSKVLGRSKKKKEVEKDLLLTLAPPSGLEPETL